jgi:hypothetical protein
MPSTKRPKPLYRRGRFALYPRGERNLEIIWYDQARKRERSASAHTRDPEQGRLALDRLFLADSGSRHCPTCGRPWEAEGSPLLATIIADDLIRAEGKAGEKSIRTRLGHVARYLAAKEPELTAAAADDAFAERFRRWMLAEKTAGGQRGGGARPRAIGAVEGCLLQLAAAINATPGQRAGFRRAQLRAVARSPVYRAGVETLAAMFNYCLRPAGPAIEHHFAPGRPNEKLRALRIAERASLLAYLRAAVATWARPDAIYDIDSRQWHRDARVLDLNPPHRRQTRKFRPKIPVARQFAAHLDDLDGQWLKVASVRASWDRMAAALKLPREGEAGEKLIRRSIATLARRRIGEAQWRQGEMMLGHVKTSVSDIYALPDPANLGLALAATEAIIDEIEALAPGAFNRTFTANAGKLAAVE